MKSMIWFFVAIAGLTLMSCSYPTAEDRAWEKVQYLKKLSSEDKSKFMEGTWRGQTFSRVNRYGTKTLVDTIVAFTFNSNKTWTLIVKSDTLKGEWFLTDDWGLHSAMDLLEDARLSDFLLVLDRLPDVEGLSETVFGGRFEETGVVLARSRVLAFGVIISHYWHLRK